MYVGPDNQESLEELVRGFRETKGEIVALCEAVRWRVSSVVLEILDNKVDPDSRTPDGLTPLMYCNHKKIGEILISKGAAINARDPLGRTPLIWYLSGLYKKNEAKSYVKWIVKSGAGISDVSSLGECAKDMAKKKYDIDLGTLC